MSVGDDELKISVPRASVTSLALVPIAAPRADPQHELAMFERFALPDDEGCRLLGTWMNLPGLGGNAIMIQRATTAGRDLVMYPRFKGYEVWFRSAWGRQKFLMLECDVLKECPAYQVWPWCSFCSRFIMEGHRGGKGHQRCRYYLRYDSDAEINMIKDKCMGNMLSWRH
jgi:hypothetical protein